MVQTQPKFNVSFKEEAILSIQTQQRGEVVIILDDSTKTDLDKVTYYSLSDVKKADFTTDNYNLLTLCFMGNPTKVTVVKKETEIADTLDKLAFYDNYILVYPSMQSSEDVAIKTYIKNQREKNNYCIAILSGVTAPDAQYIVNFATSSVTALVNGTEETFSGSEYTCRIAGALGGLASTRSLTYYELPEIVDCELSSTEDADVKNGKLIVIHQDGTFKLGRAVNSLTTLTDGLTEAFQKIRVCNIMDIIANDIVSTFRLNYVGKYTNTYTNKLRFVNAINGYLLDRVAEGLLDGDNQNLVKVSYEKNRSYLQGKGIDVSQMTYDEILHANTGSKVLLDGVCSPADTMEDLDLIMYLYQALEL